MTSAGTEATESAIKLSRIYGSSVNKEKIGIISIKEIGMAELWVLKCSQVKMMLQNGLVF